MYFRLHLLADVLSRDCVGARRRLVVWDLTDNTGNHVWRNQRSCGVAGSKVVAAGYEAEITPGGGYLGL